MKRPTEKHVRAIIRSTNLLENGLADIVEQRFLTAMNRDILLLNEVRDFLQDMINRPPLPFSDKVLSVGEDLLNQIDDEPNEAH